MKKIILMSVIAATVLFACSKDKDFDEQATAGSDREQSMKATSSGKDSIPPLPTAPEIPAEPTDTGKYVTPPPMPPAPVEPSPVDKDTSKYATPQPAPPAPVDPSPVDKDSSKFVRN